MLKRGVMGTYHYVSPKYTQPYATEFEGRHNANVPDLGMTGKVREVMAGLHRHRLTWRKLVGRRGNAATWQPGLSRHVDRVYCGGTYIQREHEILTGAFVADWRTGLPPEG